MKTQSNIDVAFELLLGSINDTETSIRQEAANAIIRPGGSLSGVGQLGVEVVRLAKLREGVKQLQRVFRGQKKVIQPRIKTRSPVTTILLESLYLECIADGREWLNKEIAQSIGSKIGHLATSYDLELCKGIPRWESKLRSAKGRLLAAGKIETVALKSVRIVRAQPLTVE